MYLISEKYEILLCILVVYHQLKYFLFIKYGHIFNKYSHKKITYSLYDDKKKSIKNDWYIYKSSNSSNRFVTGALKEEVRQLFRQQIIVSNNVNRYKYIIKIYKTK